MPAKRQQPARRRLTREGIVEAATSIVERDGLDGLTMRALASELAADPSAVYRHFRDKDAVVAAVLERLVGEMEVPPPTGDWRADIRAVVLQMRATLTRRPGLALVLAGELPPTPAVLAFTARVAEHIEEAGLPDRAHATAALRSIFAFVVGWSVLDAGNAGAAPDARDAALRAASAVLPAGAGPQAAQVVSAVVWDVQDAELFERGLELLIAGIAATR